MTLHRHEKLTATPARLRDGGRVRLRCAVSSAAARSTADIAYSLAPGVPYRFRLADGTLTRRFVDPGVAIRSAPTPIERTVTLRHHPDGDGPAFFYITATLTEYRTGSTLRTAAPILAPMPTGDSVTRATRPS